MDIRQAYTQIVELEMLQIATHIEYESVNIWPLIRHCLWFELVQAKPYKQGLFKNEDTSAWRSFLHHTHNLLDQAKNTDLFFSRDSNKAFFSRPTYLQLLPNGQLFDRIVDPLMFVSSGDFRFEKFYVSRRAQKGALRFPARTLIPTPTKIYAPVTSRDLDALKELASLAHLEVSRFLVRLSQALSSFIRWRDLGLKLFAKRPQIREIYLASWYFPDMMGIIAAAHEHGIKVIDVQHGKQGKYQAMYSGWQVPHPGGFKLMPDHFWCWGQRSCDHILRSDPDRINHRPFVGGFPWIDYYLKNISTEPMAERNTPRRTILITIQPPQSNNYEPLPDFIINYIVSGDHNDFFIIRCHPNDPNGVEYCKQRLSGVSTDVYDLDPGDVNLYEQFRKTTHHITAYSSCCYEASVFGIPTFLFGVDAYHIYRGDIEAGEFSWHVGSTAALTEWLDNQVAAPTGSWSDHKYIISSLSLARASLFNNGST